MTPLNDVLQKFADIADHPGEVYQRHIDEGKKVVLYGPLYGPEEIADSMGMVPYGVWGVDEEINEAKRYFPAFIPSMLQSILELGIRGDYKGATAFTQPLLSDSTKCLGENWKYAVPDIPYIPMQYPQNRKPDYGIAFTEANYRYFAKELERISGVAFSEENLKKSIEIYNKHNELMRKADELMSRKQVTNKQRNDVFKSGCLIPKEEHNKLLEELIEALEQAPDDTESRRIVTSGIVADSPNLLKMIDDAGLKIVGDDMAQESRQYRTETRLDIEDPIRALAQKFSDLDNCSLLYDKDKLRAQFIVDLCKDRGATGVVFLHTKFSDPEEFDHVIIKKALVDNDINNVIIEIDRQMQNYEQAQTILQTFSDII